MKPKITREKDSGENNAKNADEGIFDDESKFIVVSRHYFLIAILACTIAGIGIGGILMFLIPLYLRSR